MTPWNQRLTREEQLKTHTHDGFWQCMDAYREQQLFEGMWKSGEAPWKKWSCERRDRR